MNKVDNSKTDLLIAAMEIIASQYPRPSEEDFEDMAEKLRENPPAELSPETVNLLISILTGNNPHA